MKNRIKETKEYNNKYRLGLVGFSCALATLILAIISSVVLSQEAQAKEYQTRVINWGEICRNPIVDAVIVEPCNTLTTPDGYTLTAEGERVARCIAGGLVLFIIDPSGQTLAAAQALGPAVGCGGGGEGKGITDDNPITDMLQPIGDSRTNNNNPTLTIHENELLSAESSKQNGLKVIVSFIKGYGYHSEDYYKVYVGTGNCNNYHYRSLCTGNEKVYQLGDKSSLAYTFYKGAVPIGAPFFIYVENLDNNHKICEEGYNSPNHKPEYITIQLPS